MDTSRFASNIIKRLDLDKPKPEAFSLPERTYENHVTYLDCMRIPEFFDPPEAYTKYGHFRPDAQEIARYEEGREVVKAAHESGELEESDYQQIMTPHGFISTEHVHWFRMNAAYRKAHFIPVRWGRTGKDKEKLIYFLLDSEDNPTWLELVADDTFTRLPIHPEGETKALRHAPLLLERIEEWRNPYDYGHEIWEYETYRDGKTPKPLPETAKPFYEKILARRLEYENDPPIYHLNREWTYTNYFKKKSGTGKQSIEMLLSETNNSKQAGDYKP